MAEATLILAALGVILNGVGLVIRILVWRRYERCP